MDLKYILKRVLIGVAIGVILMLIRGNLLISASAKTIESYSWGWHTDSISYSANSWNFSLSDNKWLGERYGYLYFTFSLVSSTQASPSIRSVVVTSGTVNYVCHVGTVSNSSELSGTNTMITQTFSAYCPVDFGSSGLDMVTLNFWPYSSSNPYYFQLSISSQASFETTDEIVLNQSDTTNAINNQTTTITNNQNQNTQQQIESQQVCSVYDINATKDFGYLEATDGTVHSTQNSKVTDFIPLSSSDKLTLLDNATQNNNAICFYNVNKSYISCMTRTQYASLTDITIPNNTSYVRFTINVEQNKPQWKICKNGNQALADQQQNLNDSLSNNDISGASSSGSDFFTNFAEPSNPLLDVLLFPIHLLDSVDDTCQPITLSLFNQNVTLPCGTTVFWNRSDVATFRTWWNLFVGGLSIYLLCLKLFHTISDAADPFKDGLSGLGGF